MKILRRVYPLLRLPKGARYDEVYEALFRRPSPFGTSILSIHVHKMNNGNAPEQPDTSLSAKLKKRKTHNTCTNSGRRHREEEIP